MNLISRESNDLKDEFINDMNSISPPTVSLKREFTECHDEILVIGNVFKVLYSVVMEEVAPDRAVQWHRFYTDSTKHREITDHQGKLDFILSKLAPKRRSGNE